MGQAVICQNRRTKTAYMVEQTGVNLYSLEELAFFLYHNICLVDQGFFDERLCRWLEQELGCGDLAKRIRKGTASGGNLTNLVISVVGASDLYDSRELTELGEQMKAIGSMQEQERLKLRADELLDNGNDWAAMEEYRHILRMHQNLKLGVSFYGAVWNNLGVCFARQFLFERAKDCFEHALEYTPDEEIRKQAELAEKLMYGPAPLSGTVKNEDQPQRQLLSWEQEYRTRRRQ